MKFVRPLLVLCVLTTHRLGCAQTPPPLGEFPFQPDPGQNAHDRALTATGEIIQVEMAFAAAARLKGVRNAFVAYFEPEGLSFEPEPVRVVDAYPKLPPPPPNAPKTELRWSPDTAGASADGTIGFATGPWVFRRLDAAVPDPGRHGRFFSVLRRQVDGAWKVVLDFGITGGTRTEPVDRSPAVARAFSGNRTPRPAASAAEFAGAAAAFEDAFTRRAWANLGLLVAKEAKLSLPERGEIPCADLSPSDWEAMIPPNLRWELLGRLVAESGDFITTWGKWHAPSEKPETGYYLEVWVRERALDRWQLLYLLRK